MNTTVAINTRVDDYIQAIKSAGLVVKKVEDNPHYRFVSDNARGATETYGVKSVSILAQKPIRQAVLLFQNDHTARAGRVGLFCNCRLPAGCHSVLRGSQPGIYRQLPMTFSG